VAETRHGLLEQIYQERNWAILSKDLQPDHVHLFVALPPAVADAVKNPQGEYGTAIVPADPLAETATGEWTLVVSIVQCGNCGECQR